MNATLTLVAATLFAASAQAGNLDSYMNRIQAANWAADVPALQALCRELDQAASAGSDAEGRYVAAYCDYRVAHAGKKDTASHEPAMNAALDRAEARLTALGAEAGPYQAEALALLSSVYGLQIGLSPLKGFTLGPKAGKAIARAEALAPANPRVQLFKATGKLFTPALFGGDRAEAVRALDQAIAALPAGHSDAVNWGLEDAYVWRSIALSETDPAAAKASLEQALAVAPDYGWARYQLARLNRSE